MSTLAIDRDELIRHHMRFARGIVWQAIRVLPAHIDADDVIGDAFEGLCRAANAFDPAVGVDFEFFAYKFVRGAITDGARRRDWGSRGDRRAEREMRAVRARIIATEHRQPTRQEFADALGLSLAKLDRLEARLARSHPDSLNETFATRDADEPIELVDTIADPHADTAEAATDRVIARQLAPLVRSLPVKQRVVLAARLDGDRLREAGARVQVTESRACQLERAAMERLRRQMAA